MQKSTKNKNLTQKYKKANNQLNKISGDNVHKIIAIDFSKVFYNDCFDKNVKIRSDDEIDNIRKRAEGYFANYIDDNFDNFLQGISFLIGHIRFPVLQYTYGVVPVNHFFSIKTPNNTSTCCKLALEKLMGSVGN